MDTRSKRHTAQCLSIRPARLRLYARHREPSCSAGSGQVLSATFTPTDSTDYNSVTTTTTLSVQKSTPTITWANPTAITYGTPLEAADPAPGHRVRPRHLHLHTRRGHRSEGRYRASPVGHVHPQRYDRLHLGYDHCDDQRSRKATPTISWAQSPADITSPARPLGRRPPAHDATHLRPGYLPAHTRLPRVPCSERRVWASLCR